MAKEIACHDVVPGCGFMANAATEEELIAKVAEHARVAHGISKVTPELLTKVRGAIKEKR